MEDVFNVKGLPKVDPSALVRWIIATMPWLTNEHKRYLGAEEAKLRRTLETGEEYIQD